jgi:hypothetical protein
MAYVFMLLFIFGSPGGQAQGTYTLEDLEVLAQENNFQEYLDHALDIRPSLRLDNWKSMTAKMADLYSRHILVGPEIQKKDFYRTESLYAWPTLNIDDVFKLRRQEIGLRYLKSCLKDEKPCWEVLEKFWQDSNSDPEVGFKISEILSTHKDAPAMWKYLSSSLKSPLSEFYCKKEFVQKTLWNKLEIDYIRLATQGDLLKKIDETIHPDCLLELNKVSYQKLYAPEGENDRELAYQILKAQGKADQKLSDFFLSVYLLERPSQGELFNYAWGRLKELRKEPERRDETLATIKSKLDPLPDDLMGSLDQIKKRAVLSHFKENFPEYFDFYAHQCLAYYGGGGKFPRGNPTIHCQDFMKSDLAPEIVGAEKVKKFLEIKKL